jgi:hypothetical protein
MERILRHPDAAIAGTGAKDVVSLIEPSGNVRPDGVSTDNRVGADSLSVPTVQLPRCRPPSNSSTGTTTKMYAGQIRGIRPIECSIAVPVPTMTSNAAKASVTLPQGPGKGVLPGSGRVVAVDGPVWSGLLLSADIATTVQWSVTLHWSDRFAW